MAASPASETDPRFMQAVAVVLAHEGGYIHAAADPGGATNFGVSLRFALAELAKDGDSDGFSDGDFDRDGDVDEADIRAMTVDEAAEIYRIHWWERYGYARFANDELAAKVLDLAVNMGPRQAHKCLQRAIAKVWCPLACDGLIGVQTIQFANQADPKLLLEAFAEEAATFYRDLVAAKPALGAFLKGWLNRAYS